MNFVDSYIMNREVVRSTTSTGKDIASMIIDLSQPVPEPQPVLRAGGILTASRGNISTIAGQAKSRKTFLSGAMASGFLSSADFLRFDTPSGGRVLYVDTEQSAAHVHRLARRILRSIGLPADHNYDKLTVVALREFSPAERMEAVGGLLQSLRPDLVIIDGVADLCNDTNDIRESETIVSELMRWSSEYNNHIVCVLHTNPGGDKARGHLGSSLLRKSETVILVKSDGEMSVVRPQFCRNMPFEEFAFQVSPSGIPEECAVPETPRQNSIFTEIMEEGKSYTHSELVDMISTTMGISDDAAKKRLQRGVLNGHIAKNQTGFYYIC